MFIHIDQFGHWFPQSVTQVENSEPDSSEGQNLIHSCKEPPAQYDSEGAEDVGRF